MAFTGMSGRVSIRLIESTGSEPSGETGVRRERVEMDVPDAEAHRGDLKGSIA